MTQTARVTAGAAACPLDVEMLVSIPMMAAANVSIDKNRSVLVARIEVTPV
jgi:predicted secreted protein